jgi:hypothetical protein
MNNMLSPNVTAQYAATNNNLNIQLSDAAIAVALPYSETDSGYTLSTLLTRHPQCTKVINVCFLILILGWAFWETIMMGLERFDMWLVDETMKEDHKVWMEGYWRKRRGVRLVGILKRSPVMERWVDDGTEMVTTFENNKRQGERRKRVTFGEGVKDFDGEREEMHLGMGLLRYQVPAA